MEQPVKILISSSALYKGLYNLNLDYREDSETLQIDVANGKMQIGSCLLAVEHNKPGLLNIRTARLVYLRGILSRVIDSPIMLIINGDNLFLSEIYI